MLRQVLEELNPESWEESLSVGSKHDDDEISSLFFSELAIQQRMSQYFFAK